MGPGPSIVPVPAHGPEVSSPQIVAATVGVALSFAALIIAFFGIPFYGLRERFRRDHFTDRLLAEAHLEDTAIVPALVAISDHVRQQTQEHPNESADNSLLDVHSRALVDQLVGHILDYEELRALYDGGILYGDLVWKFAGAAAVMILLFPVMRFIWMVPPNHWITSTYWAVAAVVGSGLIVVFTLYTRTRNRFMTLLETHARHA